MNQPRDWGSGGPDEWGGAAAAVSPCPRGESTDLAEGRKRTEEHRASDVPCKDGPIRSRGESRRIPLPRSAWTGEFAMVFSMCSF